MSHRDLQLKGVNKSMSLKCTNTTLCVAFFLVGIISDKRGKEVQACNINLLYM